MHIHSTQTKFDNSSMLLSIGPHMYVYNPHIFESSLSMVFVCVCVCVCVGWTPKIYLKKEKNNINTRTAFLTLHIPKKQHFKTIYMLKYIADVCYWPTFKVNCYLWYVLHQTKIKRRYRTTLFPNRPATDLFRFYSVTLRQPRSATKAHWAISRSS